MNADVLRWAIVTLAALDGALLTAGTIKRWDVLPPLLRRVVPWVIGTYVVIAYGAGEVAAHHTPVPAGFRLVLTLVDLLGLAAALSYRIHED